MPGVKSLQAQEYYGNPQNHFWKILCHLLDEELPEDYLDKLKMLKKHHIALWDTIESCERKGSKDTDIREEVPNDISGLLKDYPFIEAIFCNGQKSFNNLKKIAKENQLEIPIFCMPSTSPLHTIKMEEKMSKWQAILKFVK